MHACVPKSTMDLIILKGHANVPKNNESYKTFKFLCSTISVYLLFFFVCFKHFNN